MVRGMTVCDSTTSVRLAREWARLRFRRPVLRHADRWEIVPRPLGDLDELLDAVGRNSWSRECDLRFRRLVAIARTDDLAARVALERIRPGVLRCAARSGRGPDAFEELLASAWISIRTYNPDRRNSNLAASLLADTTWHAFRRHDRRLAAGEVAVDPVRVLHGVAAPQPEDPAVELAELLDDARAAGVPRDDLALVELLLASPRTEDVARELRVTARTVRNRRDRLVFTLRRVAQAA